MEGTLVRREDNIRKMGRFSAWRKKHAQRGEDNQEQTRIAWSRANVFQFYARAFVETKELTQYSISLA